MIAAPHVDYSCAQHSDCRAKNVGNCCGFYPECVNVDFCPDHEARRAWCQDTGTMDTCGWADIRACICKDGACSVVGYTSPESPLPAGAVLAGDIPFEEDCTTSMRSTKNSSPPFVDQSCAEHSDCKAKNVGNCCEYEFHPECVKFDFCPDLKASREWCQDTGTASKCGGADTNPTPEELYYNKDWFDLPRKIQEAYKVLGYNNEAMWNGEGIAYSEDWDWVEFTPEMKEAALRIGYTEEIWCAEGCDAYEGDGLACICDNGTCSAVGYTSPEALPAGAVLAGDIPFEEDCSTFSREPRGAKAYKPKPRRPVTRTSGAPHLHLSSFDVASSLALVLILLRGRRN